MAVWKELESRSLYRVICRANSAAVSMIRTDWFIIWKTAGFILQTAGDITGTDNYQK